MAINYIPDDNIFSDWQPHLDEQSIDKFLKECEFEEPFPDVFDLPPYQALEEIFPTDSNTSIYIGDGKWTQTTINEAHTGEEIGLGEMPLTGCTGDNKQQTETGTMEGHSEEEIVDMLKINPPNEPQTDGNGGNILEDAMFNSTLSWDGTLSGVTYCHCCNEVASMKSDIEKILFELGSVAMAVDNIKQGLHDFSYDVSSVIEGAQQWMAENGGRDH